MYLQTSRPSSNTGQVQPAESQEQQYSFVDPSLLQIVSYSEAIGTLFMLLLIIRAATKFVKEVKKDD